MRGRSLIQRDEDTDVNREDHVMSQRTMVNYKPRREGSGETYSANTLIFDLQPPHVKNKFLLFKHCVCGRLCYGCPSKVITRFTRQQGRLTYNYKIHEKQLN